MRAWLACSLRPTPAGSLRLREASESSLECSVAESSTVCRRRSPAAATRSSRMCTISAAPDRLAFKHCQASAMGLCTCIPIRYLYTPTWCNLPLPA